MELGLIDPFLLLDGGPCYQTHRLLTVRDTTWLRMGLVSLLDGRSIVPLNQGKNLTFPFILRNCCEVVYTLKGSHKGDALRFIIWGSFDDTNPCMCSI